MTKKRNEPSKGRDDDKDKKGRAREKGAVRLLTFEIEPALDDALEAFRQKDRRTKRAVLTMAIEEFLAARKAWPPPAPSGS